MKTREKVEQSTFMNGAPALAQMSHASLSVAYSGSSCRQYVSRSTTPAAAAGKRSYQLEPQELGIPRCSVQDLAGGDAALNAQILMVRGRQGGKGQDVHNDGRCRNKQQDSGDAAQAGGWRGPQSIPSLPTCSVCFT